MTRALAVVLFQGPPLRHEYYRLTFEFLKLSLLKCKDQFDKIYLVDNSANFTNEDRDWLITNFPKKIVIMLGQMDSHWSMMNMICEQVIEDSLLLIDSDTMIYNPWTIKQGFDDLKTHDVVSIFDGSGEDLNYSVMQEARRFAPYMCFLKIDTLKKTNMNFDPDSTHDSMGLLTKEILDLGAIVKRIPDDRGTIYIDGSVTPLITPLTGYYHQRNSNGGLHILTSFIEDFKSYLRDKTLMPLNERCRLLMWVKIENEMTWNDPELDNIINDIFLDWNVGNFEEYYNNFKSFYSWLGELI